MVAGAARASLSPLALRGTLDTKQRNTPVLLKSFENLAAKDHEDIGLPTDESQASTTALVKALRPKKVSHLCLGGFYSSALTDQGDLYTWGFGEMGQLANRRGGDDATPTLVGVDSSLAVLDAATSAQHSVYVVMERAD